MVCCAFSGDSNWPSNGPKRPTLTGNKFYTIGTTSGIPSENHPFPSNCLLPPQSVSAASSASRVHQYLHRLSICKLKKLSSKFNFMNVCYRGVVDPLLRPLALVWQENTGHPRTASSVPSSGGNFWYQKTARWKSILIFDHHGVSQCASNAQLCSR